MTQARRIVSGLRLLWKHSAQWVERLMDSHYGVASSLYDLEMKYELSTFKGSQSACERDLRTSSHLCLLKLLGTQEPRLPRFIKNCIDFVLHHPNIQSKTPLSRRPANNSGSKNLLTSTSSLSPFLLLVLSTKSRAAC